MLPPGAEQFGAKIRFLSGVATTHPAWLPWNGLVALQISRKEQVESGWSPYT